MIRSILKLGAALTSAAILALPTANASNINQEVAKAYNEGIVRCANADCAKYLYACFRSYSTTSLQDFLACGSQASRLNDDQQVVAPPTSSRVNTAQANAS